MKIYENYYSSILVQKWNIWSSNSKTTDDSSRDSKIFKTTGELTAKVRSWRKSSITVRDLRALTALIKQCCRSSSKELVVLWSEAVGRHISKDSCLQNIKKLEYGFYKVSLIWIKTLISLVILTSKRTEQTEETEITLGKGTSKADDQKSIIWSDESRFEVCGGDSRSRVLWLRAKLSIKIETSH